MGQQFGQGFEGLEERTLLAANVTATLIGGTLIIEGDTTDNDINVFGDGTSGQVSVNVNGQTLDVVGGKLDESNQGSFDGVNNLVVRGNDGGDYVHVSDINIAGNLTVQGGMGADYIALHADQFDTYIGGGVVLNGGFSLNDNIDVAVYGYGNELTIGGGLAMVNHGGGYGDLTIAAEYGNINIGGSVLMNSFSLLGSYGAAQIRSDNQSEVSIAGGVLMNGGMGDDFLGIFAGYGASYGYGQTTGISIGGGVIMNGGLGDDTEQITAYGFYGSVGHNSKDIQIGGNVQMLGGVGDDQLTVGGIQANVNIAGNLEMWGGLGDDTLKAIGYGPDYGSANIGGNVLADGGAGDDWIQAYGIVVNGGALVQAGGGDDSIDLVASQIGAGAWIFGQTGNDTICSENNTVNGGAAVLGGLGIDSAYSSGNDVSGFLVANSIEVVLDSCPFDR